MIDLGLPKGTPLADLPKENTLAPVENIYLQAQHLTKVFGSFRAVDGIDFTIGKGRCAALLGPNGAGKTTTLNMLCGLLSPTSGTIGLASQSDRDIRQHIGYMPQLPVFFNWMTGREFLYFAGRLFNLEKKELVSRTDELLKLMGIYEARNRRIGGYSGGMKQRLGFAQAMIHRPELLVLDEPVSALDPTGRREILELLRAMKKETTILFSTHVLHDAEDLCDDVLIMKAGKIVLSGPLDELRRAHRKPLIVVEAEVSLQEWAEGTRTLPFVTRVDSSGQTAAITVNDMTAAREYLLADLASKRLPITRFEAAYTTLENLFLEAIEA
ncbi:MAG: ABC transporter ATP-binding protein [Gorillibacterium sp.]|nr:ABC transporter ATP-binding protein [Gorillibacterium sp.]